MDERHKAILRDATDLQRKYVMARVMGASKTGATKQLRINRSTPHKWENWDQLEEVVAAVQIDQIEGARWALTNLSLDAVKALNEALADRPHKVAAANSILDRAGLPKQSQVDMTSGGEPLKVQFSWNDPDSNAQTAQSDTEADDHL